MNDTFILRPVAKAIPMKLLLRRDDGVVAVAHLRVHPPFEPEEYWSGVSEKPLWVIPSGSLWDKTSLDSVSTFPMLDMLPHRIAVVTEGRQMDSSAEMRHTLRRRLDLGDRILLLCDRLRPFPGNARILSRDSSAVTALVSYETGVLLAVANLGFNPHQPVPMRVQEINRHLRTLDQEVPPRLSPASWNVIETGIVTETFPKALAQNPASETVILIGADTRVATDMLRTRKHLLFIAPNADVISLALGDDPVVVDGDSTYCVVRRRSGTVGIYHPAAYPAESSWIFMELLTRWGVQLPGRMVSVATELEGGSE